MDDESDLFLDSEEGRIFVQRLVDEVQAAFNNPNYKYKPWRNTLEKWNVE